MHHSYPAESENTFFSRCIFRSTRVECCLNFSQQLWNKRILECSTVSTKVECQVTTIFSVFFSLVILCFVLAIGALLSDREDLICTTCENWIGSTFIILASTTLSYILLAFGCFVIGGITFSWFYVDMIKKEGKPFF